MPNVLLRMYTSLNMALMSKPVQQISSALYATLSSFVNLKGVSWHQTVLCTVLPACCVLLSLQADLCLASIYLQLLLQPGYELTFLQL